MHRSAYETGGKFLELYAPKAAKILELGAYNVNGTLRDFAKPSWNYVGVDLDIGPGVDIQIEAGKPLPFDDGSFDIIISTSVFEHDPAFWQTFLDCIRVLRPGGYVYINAPSNGTFHRYPADFWRFYPDSGRALEAWANASERPCRLVESFIGTQTEERWNDFVAIFTSPVPAKGRARKRPGWLSEAVGCYNIWREGEASILKEMDASQDAQLLDAALGSVVALKAELARVRNQLTQVTQAVAEAEQIAGALGRAKAASVQIEGATDRVEDGYCSGWAFAYATPLARLQITAYADGEVVGQTTACLERHDLREVGYGDGCCGFFLELDTARVSVAAEFALIASNGASRRELYRRVGN